MGLQQDWYSTFHEGYSKFSTLPAFTFPYLDPNPETSQRDHLATKLTMKEQSSVRWTRLE